MPQSPFKQLSLLSLALALSACKVETQSERVPQSDGADKKAVNIRVETMNREEVKDAANKAIDATAEAAKDVKDAAKGLARDTTAAVEAVKANRSETTVTVTP